MERFTQVFLITLVIFIADIAVEIYVPALPHITHFFNTNKELVKLTVGLNIVGLAVSGLFYGALSDRLGRRPVLIVGMVVFCLASLLCMVATSINTLILMRFIQGAGQGVAVVVGFASIRDFYSKEKCAQIISRLSMVVAISPTVAPIIGSMILSYSGWQMIFGALLAAGITSVLLLYFLFKETINKKKIKKSSSLKILAKSYLSIIRNKDYIMYSSIAVLNFIWLWNVITSVPFLLIEDMGVSVKEYGYLIALNVSGFILGTILNQIYVVRVGIKKMISIGIFMPLITEIVVILVFYAGLLTPLILQLIWFFSALGLAFVIGNTTTAALDKVLPEQSSRATAILVFVEMMLGAIGIYANDQFYDGTVISISVFTAICVLVSILIFFFQICYREDKCTAQ